MNREQIKAMFENVACLSRTGYHNREEAYIDSMVDNVIKMHEQTLENAIERDKEQHPST